MLAVIRGLRSEMWSALPGIVVSFNAEAQTCEVQPAIKAVIRDPLGAENWVDLPVLPDVPVVFPRGGGYALTFPIQPGDECLVVFSSRCIDAWWQSGGTQQQIEQRLHDLSDGFCIPGPTSQPRKLSNVSTSSVQLRSDDGQAFVELQGHQINVETSGNVEVTATNITLNGNVLINGSITQINGPTSLEGPVTGAGGIGLESHVHGNVQNGGGQTSLPQEL
jgi:hypothetical protein